MNAPQAHIGSDFREIAVQHLALAAEFADLAARAEAAGDTFGASHFARRAHEEIRAFWPAHVNLRDEEELRVRT
jgi:hypothetical protein